MLFLLLTGGEPVLRPDFSEIYDAMSQMGPSISINTNGTMLSKQARELLERRPPSQLNVTLYGPNEATYDALCGNSRAFEKTIDTLRWGKRYRHFTECECYSHTMEYGSDYRTGSSSGQGKPSFKVDLL
jgi:MoaA/NifB/PqqE/SkfB family radical SAM enzyme